MLHTKKRGNVTKIEDQGITQFDGLRQELLARSHGLGHDIPGRPERAELVNGGYNPRCIFGGSRGIIESRRGQHVED